MNATNVAALSLGAAATLVGLYGLLQTKPLPLSARLGELAPLDRSHDGRISPAEWAAAGRTPEAMAALDRNGDGFVEPSEAVRRRGGGGE